MIESSIARQKDVNWNIGCEHNKQCSAFFPSHYAVWVAVWKDPAGLHGRAVLPDRSTAPVPVPQHGLPLHLDPRCRLCHRWAKTPCQWGMVGSLGWRAINKGQTTTLLTPLYPSYFPPWPGDEQCRYMCQCKGENFIVSRGSQFVDGTRCEPDSPAPLGATTACLGGTCQVKACFGFSTLESSSDALRNYY